MSRSAGNLCLREDAGSVVGQILWEPLAKEWMDKARSLNSSRFVLGNHVSPKRLFFDKPFNSILCSTPTFADSYQWLPSVAQNIQKNE